MKLSRKSWHYKLTNNIIYMNDLDFKLRYGSGVSLCPYFWAVVICVFLVGVVLPIMGIIALFLATIPFTWWTQPEFKFLVVAIIIGGLEIGALLVFWAELRKARDGKILPGKLKEKSLLYHWLKAKHEKICPMLEAD